MDTLEASLRDAQQKTLTWVTASNFYQTQLQTMNAQLATLGKDLQNYGAAEKVLSDIIAQCSAETKASIEAFLSLSLQQIFENPNIRIELLQEVKRDRVETRVILHDGVISGPPSKIAGGGVQNVIGFLMRFLALRRMGLQPIMILDEAFRNVSVDHLPKLCSFLKHLTKDHGISILLATHDPLLIKSADKAYQLAKIDGELTVAAVFEASVSD